MNTNQGRPEHISSKKLFSFAVISDTHLNQEEDECNSPFPVNRLGNGRLRHVIRELNACDIEFVVNLGDLIHPVPTVVPLYERAAGLFLDQVKELKVPLHLVPGNHDVGDKPSQWSPAESVTEKNLKLWAKFFGPHFHSFTRRGTQSDVHFIAINSQIINSGLKTETVQQQWVERELERHENARIILFTHYPPYLYDPAENEHYDNIAEPGRSWLLSLIERYRVEALFAGHVHNFWYHRHQKTHCYLLPSITFVRQDYSEMFPAPPPQGSEAGRNDTAKLGFFIVHVYPQGHDINFIRTYGQASWPHSPRPVPRQTLWQIPMRRDHRAPLGFDLRQPWANAVEIAPSGALDEFDRKSVRNDYPLLALLEMGIRKLRIPMLDLKKAQTVQRIALLRDMAYDFTLFSFGIPSEPDIALVQRQRDLLSAWEITVCEKDIKRLAACLEAVRGFDLPVFLDRLWSHDDRRPEEPYYHVINHGFLPKDKDLVAEIAGTPAISGVIRGLAFRIQGAPLEALREIRETAAGFAVSAHLKMSGTNPALAQEDELWSTNRLAEAFVAALLTDNACIFADTLSDIDRGYFMRCGVIDSSCNPRMGARVLKSLHLALGCASVFGGTSSVQESGKTIEFESDSIRYLLFLPHRQTHTGKISFPAHWEGERSHGADLISGNVCQVTLKDHTIRIDEEWKGPVLFTDAVRD